jgi:hypothetical protein
LSGNKERAFYRSREYIYFVRYGDIPVLIIVGNVPNFDIFNCQIKKGDGVKECAFTL